MIAEAKGEVPVTRFGLRLVAACALLVGLALVQSPGLLVADTKFDLVADPLGFLERAVYLWDAQGALGQLQNQAYGYLWPTGPFFLLGWLVDLPGWVVQRLWTGLVLCVAMTGAAKLTREFGVRSDLACLVAGFAFALSPRMLTTIGPISSEAWPSALAPWVLLPLVIGASRGSPHRAAALAGLAVAMVGGVNAAATFAVLPLGVLWLLTRSPGPRRRTMLMWWPVFTALGTLWWLIPLFVMGGYSPPFLDWIESASTTTFATTPFDALRGTSDWVAYLDPSWRAGNDLVRQFFLPLNSGVVLFLGIAGIVLSSSPHRLFLASGVVLGVCLVTLGHTGAVQGWFAETLQMQLDGMLAPLRNIHKFDPVVRLPLVIGLGLVLDALLTRIARSREDRPEGEPGRLDEPASRALLVRVNSYVLVGAAVAAVLGAALPAVAGRLTPGDGFASVPGYWAEAADWLGDRDATALLVPGSAFGDYVWGFPRDEPMQWLAASPWAVRNAVPLAPAGNIRMLDAIEGRLAQGRPSEGLADYLSRAGITHLVVRNDLAPSPGVPDPVLVHQALDSSPGLTRVATFGPRVGGEAHLQRDLGRILVNGGWQARYEALEIYRVSGSTGSAVGVQESPVVVGGPEDLLDLSDLGVLGREPSILAVDASEAAAAGAPLVLTDGLRATETNFGRVHDGRSATLTPGDRRRLANPTRDYLLDDDDRWSTEAVLDGAHSLAASSSMSDANAAGTVQPGQLPFAAVDGEADTMWQSSSSQADRAWWEVRFTQSRAVDEVTVSAGPGDTQIVQLRTEHGVTEPIRVAAGTPRRVRLEEPGTRWLRVEEASGRPDSRLSLAEVAVPGLSVRRLLELPMLPPEWGDPDTIVLRAVGDHRTGCAEIGGDVRCLENRRVVGEEQGSFSRRLHLARSREYDAALRVRGRPGAALDELLTAGLPVSVVASSRGVPDSRASALAAVDGDPGTTWVAALSDVDPILNINWLGRRRIDGLSLRVNPNTAARMPTVMTLVWPGGRRQVRVDEDGNVRFPPVRTDQLSLRISQARPAVSLNFDNQPSEVPIGISELRLRGLPLLPVTLPDRSVERPCGSGPTIAVNGDSLPTRVTASPREIYAGELLPAALCGGGEVSLAAGVNDIRVDGSAAFSPMSVLLGEERIPTPTLRDLDYTVLEQGQATVDPTGSSESIVVPRNVNEGWRAVQDGEVLEPFTADGWQQAWRVSGSGSTVRLAFTPDTLYGAGLLLGAMTLLLLALLTRVRQRRWPRRDDAPLAERRPHGAVVVAAGTLAAGVLAGWTGLLVALAVVAVVGFLAGRAAEAGRWMTASLVLPAAAAYAIRPWGGDSGWAGAWAWPHHLVVSVCVALLTWVALDTKRRRLRLTRRFFRRIPGISTSR